MNSDRSRRTEMGMVCDSAFRYRDVASPNSGLFKQIVDYNAAFLDLLVDVHRNSANSDATFMGLCGHQLAALERLSARARSRISDCPYLLYTVLLDRGIEYLKADRVAEPAAVEGPAGNLLDLFARSALTGAWLLTRTEPIWCRVILDMRAEDCRRFAGLSPMDLENLKGDAPNMLVARLACNPRFWPDLITLAAHGTDTQFEAARLAGIQHERGAP